MSDWQNEINNKQLVDLIMHFLCKYVVGSLKSVVFE